MPAGDRFVYFDHNATTPLDPRVRDAMLPWLGRPGANPSATHPSGQEAGRAVRLARAQVAAMIGAPEPNRLSGWHPVTE